VLLLPVARCSYQRGQSRAGWLAVAVAPAQRGCKGCHHGEPMARQGAMARRSGGMAGSEIGGRGCVDVMGSSGSACGGCRGHAGRDAATDDVEDNVNAEAIWCSRMRGRRAVADGLSAAMSVERRGEASIMATYVGTTRSWARRRRTAPRAQPQVWDGAHRAAGEHGVAGGAVWREW
jgi:hypothetical protein